MKCIVPLAGGDLLHPQYRFRPWVPVRGERLLRLALKQRAWAGKLAPADYIFVLREVDGVDALAVWLRDEWPGCTILRLSRMSGGAMLTALAGVAMLPDHEETVVIDLADILFTTGPADPESILREGVGAIIPCFIADDPCYSYLRKEAGRVVEAVEKRVISEQASAGVYIFRDGVTYLSAAQYCLAHAESVTVKGVHFICPMANGIIAAGLEVLAPLVDDVTPVGKVFHDT